MKCQVIKRSNTGNELLKSPTGKYFVKNLADEVIPVGKKEVVRLLGGEL